MVEFFEGDKPFLQSSQGAPFDAAGIWPLVTALFPISSEVTASGSLSLPKSWDSLVLMDHVTWHLKHVSFPGKPRSTVYADTWPQTRGSPGSQLHHHARITPETVDHASKRTRYQRSDPPTPGNPLSVFVSR